MQVARGSLTIPILFLSILTLYPEFFMRLYPDEFWLDKSQFIWTRKVDNPQYFI